MENGTVVPLQVAVGDKILFQKFSGAETTIEGETYLLLRESDILGVYSQGLLS